MDKFDFEKAVKKLVAGKKIGGKDGVLAPLVKELVEAALEAEIESHIADKVIWQYPKNRLKPNLTYLKRNGETNTL